ncbi:MAG TPA: hypothetical protein VGI19_03190 [Candidatus Cybelea sp.]
MPDDKAHGYKTIFSFDEADGNGPQGPLLYQSGQFYGTTSGGGDWSVAGGTVFVLGPLRAGKESFTASDAAAMGRYP